MSRTRSALVTGAGSGIGRAIAIELARAGYELVLVGRTESTLRRTARDAGTAEVAVCDLADPDAVRRLTAGIRQTSLDAVVNCAGLSVPGTLDGLSAPAARAMWSVNVLAPALLTRGCLPQLEAAAADGSPWSSTSPRRSVSGAGRAAACTRRRRPHWSR